MRQYTDIVTGTAPELLEKHALVLEMRYGLGLTYEQIQERTGLGMNTMHNIFKKYEPKPAELTLTLTVLSRLHLIEDEYEPEDTKDYSHYLKR